MASTSDIRDIMNLGAGPRPPAPKKKKRVEPQPRLAGVTREVQALMGDSVPPIAIIEQKTYKSKPSIAQKLFKPRHWEERSFQHGGRNDGLVLRHWKRSIPGTNRASTITTPIDVEMGNGHKETAQATEMRFEDEFPSDKWNVKVPVEMYTDEQYEENFKSEDWTKEETDYLMQMCRDFDLRWVLIADRYEPEDIRGEAEYPPRTMEQMKSRYYTVSARLIELQTPASNMTASEFQLWEKMRNFDAKTETMRKSVAEKLFERTKDEAEEEKILLEELHRITKNEEDFIKLRRDLYSRLESAPAIRRTERGEEQSTAMYQTSTGLSMLLQTLLAKERKLKRPQLPNGEHPTPVDQKRGQPNQYSRRETMDSQADDGPQKKGSSSQPNIRNLTAAEETKFGVAHPPERLTSGVQFRHEKINRLTMAKSQVQTSKMQAALTELGIPPRLLMPTERVCREFERLVNSIHLLLDARKVSDKVKSEIQVLEEARRIRLGLPKEGGNEAGGDAMEVDTSQVVEEKADGAEEDNAEDEREEGQEDEDQDAEGEDEDADGEKDEEVDQSMQVDDEDDEDGGSDQGFGQEEDEEAEEEDDDDEEEDETQLPNLGEDDEEEEGDESDGGDQEVSEAAQSDAEVANDSDAGEEEDEEEEDEEEAGGSDGEGEEDEEDGQEGEEADGYAEEDDDDDEEVQEDQPPPPPRLSPAHSAAARVHKRSASVVSEASKAGSNRSGLGRKKRK